MYKVRTYNKISPAGLSLLSSDKFEVSSEISEPDAVILRSQQLSPDDISPSTKAIGRAGAGVNNIPVDYCTEKGVVVFNTPGANANAVKELVVSGMLLAARNIIPASEFVNSIEDRSTLSKQVEGNKSTFKGQEIQGKTLGVIGLGAIGLMVANVGVALGMNVLGYDPFISVNRAWALSTDVDKANSLESLLRDSDFVSIHVPFTVETENFLNKNRLGYMKKGSTLLNFSRANLVDSDALLEFLNSGQIARYVSDFPQESLIDHDQVISIPHLGASTEEAEDNCAVMIVNQVDEFLSSGTIQNSVNFPDCDLDWNASHRIILANDNVPNVIGEVTSILADAGLNIVEMINKSRGDLAYNIIDVNGDFSDQVLEKLSNISSVRLSRHITNPNHG